MYHTLKYQLVFCACPCSVAFVLVSRVSIRFDSFSFHFRFVWFRFIPCASFGFVTFHFVFVSVRFVSFRFGSVRFEFPLVSLRLLYRFVSFRSLPVISFSFHIPLVGG